MHKRVTGVAVAVGALVMGGMGGPLLAACPEDLEQLSSDIREALFEDPQDISWSDQSIVDAVNLRDAARRLHEAGRSEACATTVAQAHVLLKQATDPQLLDIAQLEGKEITGSGDEQLGTVTQVLVDPTSGRIAYLLVDYGGVLGIGEATTAIPWQSVEVTPGAEDDEVKVVVNFTQDDMESAPRVEADARSGLAQRSLGRSIHNYFKATPYWQEQSGTPIVATAYSGETGEQSGAAGDQPAAPRPQAQQPEAQGGSEESAGQATSGQASEQASGGQAGATAKADDQAAGQSEDQAQGQTGGQAQGQTGAQAQDQADDSGARLSEEIAALKEQMKQLNQKMDTLSQKASLTPGSAPASAEESGGAPDTGAPDTGAKDTGAKATGSDEAAATGTAAKSSAAPAKQSGGTGAAGAKSSDPAAGQDPAAEAREERNLPDDTTGKQETENQN